LSARKAGRDAPKYFNKITEYVSSKMAEDFTPFSDIEFIDIYNDYTEIMEGYYPIYCWIVALAMNPVTFMLRTMEKRFSDKAISVVNGLLISAEQGYELIRLAEIARDDKQAQSFFEAKSFNPLLWEERLPESSPFKESFRTFLEKFGHRGVYETEISNPRWNEDPSYPLEVIRSTIHTADLGKIKARQKEKEDRAWQEINQKLSFFRRTLIRYWVKEAKKGAELREMSRSVNVRLFGLFRKMALEIGRRLTSRGIIKNQDDIFYCTFHEIFSILTGNWDGKGLCFLVEERITLKLELEAIPAPDLIIGEVPQFTEPVQHITGSGLTGMSVAAGKAAGSARLIHHPDEGKGLRSGDIMVAPSTDPGWTPLFLKVSAIVMETGGFMSHGAIVAREYGIPAVVNIPGVMNIIKDGQNIVVDGDEGKVY
jgi:pyruvate,water dikinase